LTSSCSAAKRRGAARELVEPGAAHRALAADAGDAARARLERLRQANGTRPTAAIRLEMQKIMQLDAGVFRTGRDAVSRASTSSRRFWRHSRT
jgi:succinate dehydrogenase/fumarate reductase flavoprotein subunit